MLVNNQPMMPQIKTLQKNETPKNTQGASLVALQTGQDTISFKGKVEITEDTIAALRRGDEVTAREIVKDTKNLMPNLETLAEVIAGETAYLGAKDNTQQSQALSLMKKGYAKLLKTEADNTQINSLVYDFGKTAGRIKNLDNQELIVELLNKSPINAVLKEVLKDNDSLAKVIEGTKNSTRFDPQSQTVLIKMGEIIGQSPEFPAGRVVNMAKELNTEAFLALIEGISVNNPEMVEQLTSSETLKSAQNEAMQKLNNAVESLGHGNRKSHKAAEDLYDNYPIGTVLNGIRQSANQSDTNAKIADFCQVVNEKTKDKLITEDIQRSYAHAINEQPQAIAESFIKNLENKSILGPVLQTPQATTVLKSWVSSIQQAELSGQKNEEKLKDVSKFLANYPLITGPTEEPIYDSSFVQTIPAELDKLKDDSLKDIFDELRQSINNKKAVWIDSKSQNTVASVITNFKDPVRVENFADRYQFDITIDDLGDPGTNFVKVDSSAKYNNNDELVKVLGYAGMCSAVGFSVGSGIGLGVGLATPLGVKAMELMLSESSASMASPLGGATTIGTVVGTALSTVFGTVGGIKNMVGKMREGTLKLLYPVEMIDPSTGKKAEQSAK